MHAQSVFIGFPNASQPWLIEIVEESSVIVKIAEGGNWLVKREKARAVL